MSATQAPGQLLWGNQTKADICSIGVFGPQRSSEFTCASVPVSHGVGGR